MPYDRIDPRDEDFDVRRIDESEADGEELGASLEALFSMFGGQVVEPSPPRLTHPFTAPAVFEQGRRSVSPAAAASG